MISASTRLYFRLLLIIVVLYVVYTLWTATSEGFYSPFHKLSYSHLQPNNSRYWWLPSKQLHTAHPHTKIPYGFTPAEEELGDMHLATWYRKLHNTEAIARNDVFQDPTHLHPGGGNGIDKRFFLGEALDRNRMLLQKKIRDDIAFHREPWSDAYADNLPTTPLGGNFYDCHLGNCQWKLDYDGKILGIPSQPGVRHPYY